jgi:WD40 repeat protein
MSGTVFISYSRHDTAFVDRLHERLARHGFEALVDRAEIYAFEDWWKRIQSLISGADTIIFVIAPDSVGSDVCGRELAFAKSLNKRLAPILRRSVDQDALPDELSRYNWIYFDDDARFEDNFSRLTEALSTDIEWVRRHTELGQQSLRWAAAGRPSGLLLRSPLLEEAETWIASRPQNAPAPTEETSAFIIHSRRTATARRNRLTALLGIGLAVAVGLAVAAYWQRSVAMRERDLALVAQSNFLADRSLAVANAGDATTASLLALAALPDARAGIDRPVVPAAKFALLASAQRLRDLVIRVGGPVLSVAISPDGSRVASGSYDRSAQIWDTVSGVKIATIGDFKDVVVAVQFSPDGQRIVAASRDGTAQLYAGKVIAHMTGHASAIVSAAFSPSGDRIVTASDDTTVRLWDGHTGATLGTLSGHGGKVTTASFSPDGTRVLSSSADGTAKLWRTSDGAPLATLVGHAGQVNSAEFSHDGRFIVTAGADHTVRLWNGDSGALIRTMDQEDEVAFARLNAEGTRILAASSAGTSRLLAAETGDQIAELDLNDQVTSAAFSPDGSSLVTSAADKTVRVWDARSGAEITRLTGYAAPVSAALFSPDGTRIVGASIDGTVRLWDARPGAGATRFFLPDLNLNPNREPSLNDILLTAFDSSGQRVLAVARDAILRSWTLKSEGGEAPTPTGRDLTSLATFSPDGHRLAVHRFADRGGVVSIIDAASGRAIVTVESKANVYELSFSQDGTRLMTLGFDLIVVWDALTGQKLWSLEGAADDFRDARFDETGSRIAVARTDGAAQIWNVAEGRLDTTLAPQSTWAVTRVAFTHDGSKLLTTSGDRLVRVWSLAEAKVLAVLAGHTGKIASAEFSADGDFVVTTADDETVRIWDSQTGASMAVLVARAGKPLTATFSPAGNRIVVGFTGGRVVIWDMFSQIQPLVDIAESSVQRCLTAAERSALHLEPSQPEWCNGKSAHDPPAQTVVER